MARLTPRRRAWTAVGLVGAVAAISAAAWALREWQPFADDAAEVRWPSGVEPLAEFVETTTRLTFVEPVRIEYVPDAAALAARTGTDQPPDPARLAMAGNDEALGRALGYWARDTAIDEPAPSPFTRDRTALWLADEQVLLLRLADADDTLAADVEPEVVHELTLALNQQRFDTAAMYATARTAQDRLVAVALDEGLARWTTAAYVEDQAGDRWPDDGGAGTERDVLDADPSPLPRAYLLLQRAPTLIGEGFVTALRETRRRLVAEAFTTDRPDAIDQLVQPATRYLTRDPLDPVAAPVTPEGGELIAERQLGHTGLYLVLATGLSPQEALTAADGWGNDAATMYRLDGRVCVDLHVVADSRADADRIERGLNAWAGTRPAATEALVGRDGRDLYATACDPGAETRQRVVPADAIALYEGRIAAMRQLADSTGRADLAECIAVQLFTTTDISLIELQLEFGMFGEVDEIRQECLDSL